MAEKLQFDLVSPERQLMSAEVDMVVVPGTEGEFGVMARHAPVMSSLKPGFLTVHDAGSETRMFVHGGFAEVTPQGLTVLAEEAMPAEEVDRGEIEQALRDAEEDVRDAKTDDDREKAQRRVDDLRQVLEAI